MPSNRETADDYRNVITQLDDNHRVIGCKDDIQWVVQKAEKSSHERRWRALRYFRSKLALIAFCGGLQGRYDLSELDNLPKVTYQ